MHIRYAGSRSRHDERAGGRGPSHGNAGLQQGDKATRRAVVELIQQLDGGADAVTSRAVHSGRGPHLPRIWGETAAWGADWQAQSEGEVR